MGHSQSRVNKISTGFPELKSRPMDMYFSADIETDGAIPGPNSMLSFGMTYAGAFDGETFYLPSDYRKSFYRELKPISNEFDPEALAVNGLDREKLLIEGADPVAAMTEAARWVREISEGGDPVFVAYPLSFDWSWLYWYFVRFSEQGSPFGFSRCFDIKTAIAVKHGRTVSRSGREQLPKALQSKLPHTHHALDDAIEQAVIFAKIFTNDGD